MTVERLNLEQDWVTDGKSVRVKFAGQWYLGELELWRSPPCVWVDALGCVSLDDTPRLVRQVEQLKPAK